MLAECQSCGSRDDKTKLINTLFVKAGPACQSPAHPTWLHLDQLPAPLPRRPSGPTCNSWFAPLRRLGRAEMSRAGIDSYSVAQRTCLQCCASVLALTVISLVSYLAFIMPWPPNESRSVSRDSLAPAKLTVAVRSTRLLGVAEPNLPLQEFSRNIQSLPVMPRRRSANNSPGC